jgi:Mrp family chromosome partitioning ATPase
MRDHIEVVHPLEKEAEFFPIADRKVVVSERKRRRRIDLHEHAREETIKLVQRLFVPMTANTPRVVIFSAVETGGGSSWVCARTAEVLADHLDGLVCMVDANCRSLALHRRFEIENDAKIADEEWMFAPVRRLVQPRNGANLWLLSYRPASGEWLTASSLERLQLRLSELRKDFSYVLIDGPPLNTYADAMLLGKMADGLVMVLEANSTRREAAKKTKDLLDASGVRVLGAVLNKRTFPVPDWMYRRL